MNLKEINQRISNRTDCFYWQTDRKISAEETARIWKDRHSALKNSELLDKINKELQEDKLTYIKPFDENDQTSLGNVNSIRVGVLESGKEVIIRCHPKGVKNGYFYTESLASSIAVSSGIPAYKTYCIHELENENDISYQVIEKLEGDTVQFYLKEHPECEEQLVFEMGKLMAKLHKIKVNGFGPFDNEQARNNKLVGIHKSLKDSINAGLEENIERLVTYNILTEEAANKIKKIFDDNELLNSDISVLIHNDFADWNLLTDGNTITGVIDWDECVGGNPIQEIACWSTFFEPDRITPFLKGYFSQTPMYDNFDEMFQLMRLRYTISKMALRIKRYTYEQTPFLKSMIEKGEKHLEELSEIFNLTSDNIKNDIFTKKVIVITGGSDGLGKTLAESLSIENEVIILATNEEKLINVANKNHCNYMVCDVSNYSKVEKCINELIEKFGKIDVLINNAGLWIQDELDTNDSERINAVVDVNLLGVINCSKAVIPNMKQNKEGLIININSQAGINHKAERTVYNATKWGVTGFTKSLADEVSKYGIRVSNVMPGMMKTDMFHKMNIPKNMGNAIDTKEVARLIQFMIDTPSNVIIPEVGIKNINN